MLLSHLPGNGCQSYHRRLTFGREASKGGWLKNALENLTGAANFHFFIPGAVNVAVAYGSVDKPAKISAFKFPGRALLFLLG